MCQTCEEHEHRKQTTENKPAWVYDSDSVSWSWYYESEILASVYVGKISEA